MLDAAAQGPGTAIELGNRAQVGRAAARVSASRLVARGDLVKAQDTRPAVLALPSESSGSRGAALLASALQAWQRPTALPSPDARFEDL
jgi:hypothetical protein